MSDYKLDLPPEPPDEELEAEIPNTVDPYEFNIDDYYEYEDDEDLDEERFYDDYYDDDEDDLDEEIE